MLIVIFLFFLHGGGVGDNDGGVEADNFVTVFPGGTLFAFQIGMGVKEGQLPVGPCFGVGGEFIPLGPLSREQAGQEDTVGGDESKPFVDDR